MYTRIINPLTNRKVSINSDTGIDILKNYILIGGETIKNPTNCIRWQKNYLENVCIKVNKTCINLCQNTQFLSMLFRNNFINLPEAKGIIQNLDILVKNPKYDCETFIKKEWKSCNKLCFKTLHKIIQQEIESTVYMLRLITKSVISLDKNLKVIFRYDNKKLTGLWKDDCKHFNIEKLQNTGGRLILGLGPSSSGKTYWAKNIIEILSKSNSNFPKMFLSIDGGIQRESSEIYQFIINSFKNTNMTGFKNLVTAGSGRSKSLFKASTIKKRLIKYLKFQKEKTGLNINLYVPITLGGCLKSFCNSKYKDYIDITSDNNWIGLLIYQHKKGTECTYKEKYRCIGCTESGKKREGIEGKKYSSSAYDNSMRNGIYVIKKSKGGSLIIHNTGGYKYKNNQGKLVFSKSIISDIPINNKYLLNGIPSKFNSVYIREGDELCIPAN